MTNKAIELESRSFVDSIRSSSHTIYDPIVVGDSTLWIPTPELESLLDSALRNLELKGLPIKTRSKLVKTRICHALGYPVPSSFRKTRPRFLGQLFDTYVQKSNNLQIWNDELAPARRYVLIRVSQDDVITRVKVVSGDTLAKFDTTGTLTSKFQARCVIRAETTALISANDTDVLAGALIPPGQLTLHGSPAGPPKAGELMSISTIFQRLVGLVGQCFPDTGCDQERNRGAALHRLVCSALGYTSYRDGGQFPDIRHQLLEVKLQTSPTIDLGLVLPSSTDALDVPMLGDRQVRHCDVRYAVFYAKIEEGIVTLSHLFLTTGADFFSRFPQFQGKVLNRKLQIPLPSDFFDR